MGGYLLDTNILIQSEHTVPFDIFPSFWDKLRDTLQSGEALLHERVYREIKAKKDPLADWIDGIPGLRRVEAKKELIMTAYLQVCTWAEAQGYTSAAINEFEEPTRADAWICAEALVSGYTIVTYEKASNTKNKVKIPNVCEALGLAHMTGFEFMKACGFRF